MKTIKTVLIAMLGVSLLSCQPKTNTNETSENQQEQTENLVEENSENSNNKFLITKNSVGDFIIGDSWQDIAKEN